jgi:hypothetical protein
MTIRSCTSLLLASVVGPTGITEAISQRLCRPTLTINNVQFSPMQPPTLERMWSAVVSVDASRCQANSTGYFDIVFTRLSETAPDIEFSERYAWRPPSVEVAVNFAANEAVQRFRVENITSCVCIK